MDLNLKHFMVDIETTGQKLHSDMPLEIAFLELDWVNDYWIPGRTYHRVLKCCLEPDNSFARMHHQDLYAECKEVEDASPNHVRDSILNFFDVCGCKKRDQVKLIGWDAAAFDLQVLSIHRYFYTKEFKTQETEEVIWGDYNYIVYELCGAFKLAQDVLGIGRKLETKELKNLALNAYDFPVPNGKPNRALYDCYIEAKLLNGLIKLIREFSYEG